MYMMADDDGVKGSATRRTSFGAQIMPPPRWSVACLALIASVSGCSKNSEPKLTLYRVVDERGLITYVTNDPYGDAVEKDRRDAELRRESQQQADLSQVRRRNMEAEALNRRAREEQFRQEQQDLRDYQDRRRQNEQRPSGRVQPGPVYVPRGESESERLERERRAHDD